MDTDTPLLEYILSCCDHSLDEIIFYRRSSYDAKAIEEAEAARTEIERRQLLGEIRHPKQPLFERMSDERLREKIESYRRIIDSIAHRGSPVSSPDHLTSMEAQHWLRMAAAEREQRRAAA